MYLGELIEQIDNFEEFLTLLPNSDNITRSAIFGQTLSSWIDPRTVIRIAKRLSNSEMPLKNEIFDVGLSEPIPKINETQEQLLVSLIRESSSGFKLPCTALKAIALMDPLSFQGDGLAYIEQYPITFNTIYLRKEERRSQQLFVRISSSYVGVEILQQPLAMLCSFFTQSLLNYNEEPAENTQNSFLESFASGLFWAYLNSRIAKASNVHLLAGAPPPSDETLVVNMQFNRTAIMACDPPVSAEYAERTRKAFNNLAVQSFEV